MIAAPALTKQQAAIAALWDNARSFTVMPDGTLCCVVPLMFTDAIVADLNLFGYDDRWCYQKGGSADAALARWKENYPAMAEPEGWHRHPTSGRRRTESGEEYVAP